MKKMLLLLTVCLIATMCYTNFNSNKTNPLPDFSQEQLQEIAILEEIL